MATCATAEAQSRSSKNGGIRTLAANVRSIGTLFHRQGRLGWFSSAPQRGKAEMTLGSAALTGRATHPIFQLLWQQRHDCDGLPIGGSEETDAVRMQEIAA